MIRRKANTLAVLGDLHLGRPGAPLGCRVPPETIATAAAALARDYDLVVVNGDLFDLERGSLPSQRREYELLWPVHRAATDAFSGDSFVWTRGNHDRVLEARGLAVDAVDVELPLGLVRVEHGDRFNPPIKRWPAFTMFVTWVSGRVRTVPVLRPVYVGMRLVESVLSGDSGDTGEPIVGGAARWLSGEPHRGIVVGHTHLALLRSIPDAGFVANPGQCIDLLRALSIDGTSGDVSLMEWSDEEWVPVRRASILAD